MKNFTDSSWYLKASLLILLMAKILVWAGWDTSWHKPERESPNTLKSDKYF